MLRLFVDLPLMPDGGPLDLPPGPARHAQVRRVQPGDELLLFNGHGGEWHCRVCAMGRQSVQVQVLTHQVIDRELPFAVMLAVGMPANERMDWLVEKATELGAAVLQPLHCERAVLRLTDWLGHPGLPPLRWLLSPRADARPSGPAAGGGLVVLSGPEGGLSDGEEAQAEAAGFVAVALGPRVLRAETAPLALLSWLGLGAR